MIVSLQVGKTWNGAVCCEREVPPNSSEVNFNFSLILNRQQRM